MTKGEKCLKNEKNKYFDQLTGVHASEYWLKYTMINISITLLSSALHILKILFLEFQIVFHFQSIQSIFELASRESPDKEQQKHFMENNQFMPQSDF